MNKQITKVILLITILLLMIGFGTADHPIATGADASPAPVPVENASVETHKPCNADMPARWFTDSWGDHQATFTYLHEGHSGGRSVKAEVTDYEDGDAKWFFDPIKLAPGDYQFSDYYRADVETKVVAAIFMSSGDIQYIDMPDAPPSTDWLQYEAVFTMPKDADTATVYHLLSCNGYLITDDYHMTHYHPTGFDRGLVTITFDDGWEENAATALPIMREFGYKSNQFYATTFIENPCVANPKERIMLFVEDGHEMGSHSVTHPDLTSLTSQQVTEELAGSKSFLEDYLGIRIAYFATPYGSYDTFVNANIMKYYAAHRTVDRGYNSQDNFDVSHLKCQSVLRCTTPEQVAEWVIKAKEQKLWLILLYHKVTSDPDRYDTRPEMFYEHMQVIKDAGIPVVTISQALEELESQQAKTAGLEIVYIVVFAAAAAALAVLLFFKTYSMQVWYHLSIRVRRFHRGDSQPI